MTYVAAVLFPGDNPHLDVVILGACDDVATVLLPGGARGQAHDGRLAIPPSQLLQYSKVYLHSHLLLKNFKQCRLRSSYLSQKGLTKVIVRVSEPESRYLATAEAGAVTLAWLQLTFYLNYLNI